MSQPSAPLRLHHRTTRRLLRRSLSSLLSARSLILVALLLISFRSALLAGTLRLSSLPDRDPAIYSLLRRLSFSSSSSSSSSRQHPPPPPAARRRAPFLHLTRLGTLDDDGLFSDPSSSSAGRRGSASFNASLSALFLIGGGNVGLRSSSKPLKVRLPEFVPSAPFIFSLPDAAGPVGGEGDQARADLRILGRGIDIDNRDATGVVYLLTLLSLTHALAIVGFVLAYTSALGVIFFSIVALHLRKPVSVIQAICSGAQLGMRRLTGFVFLRWAARDALIQFLCIWFFADLGDQNVLFKLFVKVKLMPFSLSPATPWPGSHDEVLWGFFFIWALVDTAMSLVLAVVPWVVIMDHDLRRRGKDLVKESFYLALLLPRQTISIKILETLVCGCLGRWMATVFGWKLLATAFLSIAEVYFMVVWLLLYFAARCKDGELIGRPFGARDLENFLNGLR